MSEPTIFAANTFGVQEQRYPTIGASARRVDRFGAIETDEGRMTCRVTTSAPPPRPDCASQGVISGPGTTVRASNGSWGGNGAVNLGGACAFAGSGQYIEAVEDVWFLTTWQAAAWRTRVVHLPYLSEMCLDPTPPTYAALAVTGVPPPGTVGTSPVRIQLGPDDSRSGISGAPYCTDRAGPKTSMQRVISDQYRYDVGGDGAHVVTCVVADRAGNTTTVGTWSFTLDVASPTLTVRHAGDAGSATSLTDPTFVDVAAADSGTGLAAVPSCTVDGVAASLTEAGGSGTPFAPGETTGAWKLAVTGAGVHTVSCSVRDRSPSPAGGRVTSASDTFTINTTTATVTAAAVVRPDGYYSSIRALFSQPIRTETIRSPAFFGTVGTNLYLERPDGTRVAAETEEFTYLITCSPTCVTTPSTYWGFQFTTLPTGPLYLVVNPPGAPPILDTFGRTLASARLPWPLTAPSFASPAEAVFSVGAAGRFTISASGIPAATLSGGGPLPAGVVATLGAGGTALLSGTPAPGTGGVYTMQLTASNGIAPNATQTLTIVVRQAPAVSGPGTAGLTAGQPLAGPAFAASGYPAPAFGLAGDVPAGIAIGTGPGGTARLVGTPGTGSGGVHSVRVVAVNAAGASELPLVLTVQEAPALGDPGPLVFHVGEAASHDVAATGYPAAAIALPAGALPAGLTLTDDGAGRATIAGVPAARAGGMHEVTIEAANGVGAAATRRLTLSITEAPTVVDPGLLVFTVGVAGTATLASGHAFPAAGLAVAGALPPGVGVVVHPDGTATIAGTPAAGSEGTYGLDVTADNGDGSPATRHVTLTVEAPPPAPPPGSAGTPDPGPVPGATAKEQSIAASVPRRLVVGTTRLLRATSTSGLPVVFTASPARVCRVLASGRLRAVARGTCTVTAAQGGNGTWLPARSVVTAVLVVPGRVVAVGRPSPGTLALAAALRSGVAVRVRVDGRTTLRAAAYLRGRLVSRAVRMPVASARRVRVVLRLLDTPALRRALMTGPQRVELRFEAGGARRSTTVLLRA